MEERKAPPILLFLGIIVMVGLPLVFFYFGWHSVDVECSRHEQRVTCRVAESFAAGIHVRKAVAEDVSNIAYNTSSSRSSGTKPQTVLTSNLVFETASGEVGISSISSNTADDAKRALIRQFRAWLDDKSAQQFEHHANMTDIFGWVGAAGVTFWTWLLLSWPYYYLKQRKAAQR